HTHFVQPRNRIFEGADPGDNHLVGSADPIRIAGDDRLRADFFQRFLHAAEVTHPVVDDNNWLLHGGVLTRGLTPLGSPRLCARCLARHASPGGVAEDSSIPASGYSLPPPMEPSAVR